MPRTPKVLILDDSEIVRALVVNALGERGYIVVPLTSPFELTSAIRRERPDLVLIDVNMPAVTGDKVVEFARRAEIPTCPIVLFSDRPEAELSQLVAQCGASGYIRKGEDVGSLADRVQRFLRR
jgi:CheY-like chemotaxis protein